jgi:hypothetical protein
MRWLIGVDADTETKKRLQWVDAFDGWAVESEGDALFIAVDHADYPDIDAARARADALLQRANRRIGSASLTAFAPATLGGMTVSDYGDGRRGVTVHPSTGFAFIEATVEIDTDGTIRFNPLAVTLKSLFREFEDDPTVCAAMDFLTTSENRAGNLYKVLEIVAYDVGASTRNADALYRDKVINTGIATIIRDYNGFTQADFDRFKGSMNQERHAGLPVPANPMDEDEAYAMMRRLVYQWLMRKSAERSDDD